MEWEFQSFFTGVRRNHGFFVMGGSLVLISSKLLSTLIYVPISMALFQKIAVIQISEAWETLSKQTGKHNER